jgi:hypothetical protein
VEDAEIADMLKQGQIPYGESAESRAHDALFHAVGYATASRRVFELVKSGKISAENFTTGLTLHSPKQIAHYYRHAGMSPFSAGVLAWRDVREQKRNLGALREAARSTSYQLPERQPDTD